MSSNITYKWRHSIYLVLPMILRKSLAGAFNLPIIYSLHKSVHHLRRNAQNQLLSLQGNRPRGVAVFMTTEGDEDEEELRSIPGASSCNVLGTSLSPCCEDVRGSGIGTGFYRNGYCSTGEQDLVCIVSYCRVYLKLFTLDYLSEERKNLCCNYYNNREGILSASKSQMTFSLTLRQLVTIFRKYN